MHCSVGDCLGLLVLLAPLLVITYGIWEARRDNDKRGAVLPPNNERKALEAFFFTMTGDWPRFDERGDLLFDYRKQSVRYEPPAGD